MQNKQNAELLRQLRIIHKLVGEELRERGIEEIKSFDELVGSGEIMLAACRAESMEMVAGGWWQPSASK